MATATSSARSGQDLASDAAAQNSQAALLASLRQIRATGRIVLKFRPESTFTNILPDIPLENGDRFTVPSVPATINVVGAVYDQNSFLYTNGQKAGVYLRLAGGPNRDADRKHAFIIRADGQVVSREMSNNLWGNDFMTWA